MPARGKEYGPRRPDDGFASRLEREGKDAVARCARCGREERTRITPLGGMNRAKRRLRLLFSRCPECGAWYCDDCFLCSDGRDSIRLCLTCAEKRGVTGLTTARALKGPEEKRQHKTGGKT